MTAADQFGRPLQSLRLSVTDRCNLRCAYCMPEEEYAWLSRQEILHFEELTRVARCFADLGVRRLRITGGEPLVRRELHRLVAMLAQDRRIEDLALTTNGVLFPDQAVALRRAGLGRVTISLDTLRRDTFVRLTRRDQLARTLAAFGAARAAGFTGTKIDTVVLRGVNDDEIPALLEFARDAGAELRFIEYMDVGGATGWTAEQVFPRAEILARVAARFGPVRPLGGRGSAPAERFVLPDGTTFGVIGSTTAPFCGACDRGRVTADGTFFTCLYAREGLDLRALLRGGAGDRELTRRIEATWQARRDRGAETRASLTRRAPLASAAELREEPQLEMHRRGG
jgi:cyclic pyranopterin phosphate synthase